MMTTVETETLDQMLDPLEQMLTLEQVERILALRASPTAQARLEWLAHQHAESRLSAEEQAEYSALVYSGALISLFQAKARRLLHDSPSD